MMRTFILSLALLMACADSSTDPGEVRLLDSTLLPPTNLYTSDADLSDITGSPYCAPGWFAGACWQPGIYDNPANGNKAGTNTPAWLGPAPLPPAAEAIVMMCMSNCVLIEDSLAPRLPNLVRCSAGGLTTGFLQGDTINHSSGNPWDNCDANLAARGYAPSDVGLVITKPGDSYPANMGGLIENARRSSEFGATAAKVLQQQIVGMGRTVKRRYVNASLGFTDLAATHHSVNSSKPNFLPPKYTHEFGYAVRWAITQQDSTTAFMFWVAYTHDPTDPAIYYENDGAHPSALGASVRAAAICAGLNNSPYTTWVTCPPVGTTATWVPTGAVCGTGFCDVSGLLNGQPRTVRVQ